MSTKRLNPDEVDAKTWDIPYVESVVSDREKTKTNALNRRSDWVYEPPEVEEEILPPTAEEIEAIRQAAYDEGHAEGKHIGYQEGKEEGLEAGKQEGFDAGFEEGKQSGFDTGEQTVNELASHWKSLSEQIHQPLYQVSEQARQELTKLAVALAKAVIKTECTTSESAVLQALSEGLKALPINENRYQIHMNPDDIVMVKAHFGDNVESEKGWQFVDAPALERGGCDITTEHNAVDVSVERRTKEILTKFLLEQGLSDE